VGKIFCFEGDQETASGSCGAFQILLEKVERKAPRSLCDTSSSQRCPRTGTLDPDFDGPFRSKPQEPTEQIRWPRHRSSFLPPLFVTVDPGGTKPASILRFVRGMEVGTTYRRGREQKNRRSGSRRVADLEARTSRRWRAGAGSGRSCDRAALGRIPVRSRSD
jgi:hypothetical protein